MSEMVFIKYKKRLRIVTWISYSLLAFGVANCIGSVYLTALDQAPVWPLACIIVAVIALLVIQHRLERHEQ